LHRGVLRCR